MDYLNRGVILADDMGLGKTIQIIAFLETLKKAKPDLRALVVVPTSLLANWEEEIKKFAPKADYKSCHGTNREISDYITLTSYGILRREEKLSQIDWDLVIIDEAQAIKNPNTQQTRAVKNLSARIKIAMTGTPIENDLMILSLRAGGVGLNLTGANHVIHFDRWWNPQIEKQATDRAYRIGQKKDVMVHYLICRDTIDISIDQMLEEKIAMSEGIISENKSPSLTEMDDNDLKEFFALRKGE